MPHVYVAAGSNSEPVAHLRAAAAALERAFGAGRRSAVFRSAAEGASAPDYLNLVFTFDSERDAAALKSAFVAIEAAAGRTRGQPRQALCALDLDLLLHGARVDALQRLPHADVLRRAFVLAPLAELAPSVVHPVTGEAFATAWARLGSTAPAVTKIGELETIEG